MLNRVLGQNPNKANCVSFFSNPAVKYLWINQYMKSKEFKNWKQKVMAFTPSEIKRMNKYLMKLNIDLRYEPVQ